MSNKIEPLTQQHALEIANDWHYEAPYDFYDMKNDLEDYEEMISPIRAWGPLLSSYARRETLWIFLLRAERRANFGAWFGDEAGALRKRSGRWISAGNSGLYYGKFCAPSHKFIRG